MVKHRGKYLGGREALAELDLKIGSVRRTLSDALEDAEGAEARQAELRKAQAEAYAALAKIRLDFVATGVSLDDLAGAERKAHQLLQKHDDHAEKQQALVEKSATEIAKLESERSQSAVILDQAVEAYEDCVEQIEANLETNSSYLELAERLEETGAIVARSEQKLELALEDQKTKGVPYDNDPLFSYLWKRGFRTTDYKGRGITKMLDGWVARLIKFDRARLNYARLTELPVRLEEHVERVKQERLDAQNTLEEAEQTALIDGGAAELEVAANARRVELEAFDKKIEEAERNHLKIVATHDDVLSGGKGPAAEARKVLEQALRVASFPDLRMLAAETIELHDDRIVDELVKLRAEQMSLELDESDVHARPARIKDDLVSLEKLRSQFKRARYDSPYASFKTSVIERVLSGMASGRLDVSKALSMLRKGLVQRQPRTPRGFGGKRRNDTLGMPEVVGDVLWEVLKQSGRGGWGSGGRARPIKRRSPRIKPRIGSSGKKSDRKKGGGFKTTDGF